MNNKIFEEGKPVDFEDWIGVPKTEEQRNLWQKLNRSWWESNPMRYDFSPEKIPYPEYTREFYEEIDRRFYQNVYEFMPWENVPFNPLIDFESLRNKNVLEIGVGCGSHAQLLAQHARSFTGIDLTEYAVNATTRRLRCFGIQGNIIRMDAEKMEFKDNTFDFVWSWGVIHHSSNTPKILEEIYRVLRPGGKAITMVYHRSLWNIYLRGLLFLGILRGGLLKTRSLNMLVQQSSDGALARYYTIAEWKALLTKLFIVQNIPVFGSKSQLIPLPRGRAREFLASLVPNSVGRFITNRPCVGSLLVSSFQKKQGQ